MTDILLDKNAYCISINDRKYEQLCLNFKRQNLLLPIFVEGIKAQDPVVGCTESHKKVLQLAKLLDLEYIIIYEDDAYPCINVKEKFKDICNEIVKNNIDFGCISLGRNGEASGWNGQMGPLYHMNFTFKQKAQKPFSLFSTNLTFLSDNLLSIPKYPFGSHAYVVMNKYFQIAIDRFLYAYETDLSLSYPALNTIFTKECLFILKNADGSYYYPTYYNECFMGGIYKSQTLPKGFE